MANTIAAREEAYHEALVLKDTAEIALDEAEKLYEFAKGKRVLSMGEEYPNANQLYVRSKIAVEEGTPDTDLWKSARTRARCRAAWLRMKTRVEQFKNMYWAALKTSV